MAARDANWGSIRWDGEPKAISARANMIINRCWLSTPEPEVHEGIQRLIYNLELTIFVIHDSMLALLPSLLI